MAEEIGCRRVGGNLGSISTIVNRTATGLFDGQVQPRFQFDAYLFSPTAGGWSEISVNSLQRIQRTFRSCSE